VAGDKSIKLGKLLNQIAHNQDDKTMQEAYEAYNKLVQNAPTSTRLERVLKSDLEQLLGSLLDPMSFPNRNEFAEGLKQAYQRVQEDGTTLDNLRGAIGLVCFMLELLDAAEKQKQDQAPSLDWPNELLKDSAVRDWFKKVYAPQSQKPAAIQNSLTKKQEEENLKQAVEHWKELNLKDPLGPDIPDPLVLYRVGTTSFIRQSRINPLVGEKLVLKCLLFPYTRVPDITEATRSYAWQYPAGTMPATTRVRSSTDKWILMDFVEGCTLQKFLQDRRESEKTASTPFLLRTDLLSSIGKPLLEALNELSRVGFQHEDLTPSNMIVRTKPDKTIDKIVFIDLGRNHLYTHHLGLEANREALFVAPEMKNGGCSDTADLYSFGMILVDLADPIGVQGHTIPDSLYQYAPHLARFIEDLIDKEPKNRLLIFSPRDRKDRYPELCSTFTDLLKVLPSESEVKPGKFFWVQQFRMLFYPSRQLTRTRELWRITRSSSTHPEIAKHTGRLYGWLVISTISWYLIFLVSIVWGARDFGMNPFLPAYISIPQTLIPGCGGTCVPFFDKLQAPGYIFSSVNLPARMVGFSVGLAQTAYYQNILAGLTVRPMSGKLASITEFFLRFMAVVPLPLVLIGNLYQPNWWLELVILGYPIPALTNILCYQLAIRTLNKARGELSTVPLLDDHSLKNFGQWGTTIAFYIMLMIGIWIGLQTHFLHDGLAYAIVGVGINVFVLCITKCILLAPGVRGSLSRAFILGERLKAVQDRDLPGESIS